MSPLALVGMSLLSKSWTAEALLSFPPGPAPAARIGLVPRTDGFRHKPPKDPHHPVLLREAPGGSAGASRDGGRARRWAWEAKDG